MPLTQPVTAYDIPSNMGGSFTASIVEDMGDKVKVRIWYGKPTAKGWKSWGDYDGTTRIVAKADLKNEHTLFMVRKVEDQNSGFFFVQPYEAENYKPEDVVKRYLTVYPDSDVFRIEEVNSDRRTIKGYIVSPEELTAEQMAAAHDRQKNSAFPWIEL